MLHFDYISAVLLLLLIVNVGASPLSLDSDMPVHMLTNTPMMNSDVLVSFYYPEKDMSKGRKMPTGEDIAVLVHFANEGDTPLKITGFMGSLNDVKDFSNYVQNFTYLPISQIIGPSEEVTLVYTFQIAGYTPTSKKYTVANTVFYEELIVNKGSHFPYSHTFQNNTVKLHSNLPEVDAETLMSLAMAIGTTVVVMYMTYLACFGSSDKQTRNDRPGIFSS